MILETGRINKSERKSMLHLIIILVILAAAILLGWSVLYHLPPSDYDASVLDPSYEKPQENNLIYLTADENGYSYKSEDIVIRLTNDTDNDVLYGRVYQLETLIDGKWYKVPSKKNAMFTLEAISAEPHTTSNVEIWLAAHQCRPGRHRIIQEVSIEDNREPKSLDELEHQLEENLRNQPEKKSEERIQIAVEFDLI